MAARYEPTCASVEIVFVNVNPQSTLLLGQARGAALSALVADELSVAEYTALQMKNAIVGHGQANKEQVQEMVMRLLSLPGLPGKDAADALGLAICHAHASRTFAAIARSAMLAPGTLRRGTEPGRATGPAHAVRPTLPAPPPRRQSRPPCMPSSKKPASSTPAAS